MASPRLSSSQIGLEETLCENERLSRENDQLSMDLAECQEALLDLLQKENDVSEQTVKDAFGSIFTGIEAWITEMSAGQAFDSSFTRQFTHNLQHNRAENVESLGLDPLIFDRAWQSKLGKLPSRRYVVLSLVIAQCLRRKVFRNPKARKHGNLYPPAIEDRYIETVAHLEKIMTDVLKRDQTQISRWRAEAVAALTATDEYNISLEKWKTSFLEELQEELHIWTGGQVSNEHTKLLRQNVIDRASEAMMIIGRSHKSYQFIESRSDPGSIPSRLSSCPAKDMETWRTVSAEDIVGALCCLYPGLVREGASGQTDLVLVEPTLLGYLNPELQPRTSASRTPSPSKKDKTASETVRFGAFKDSESPRARDRSSEVKSLEASQDSWSNLANFFGMRKSSTSSSQPLDVRELNKSNYRRDSKAKPSTKHPSSHDYPEPAESSAREPRRNRDDLSKEPRNPGPVDSYAPPTHAARDLKDSQKYQRAKTR